MLEFFNIEEERKSGGNFIARALHYVQASVQP